MKTVQTGAQEERKPNELRSYAPKRAERILDALSTGQSILKTARITRTAPKTVRKLRDTLTPEDIAKRKERMITEAHTIAQLAAKRIRKTIDSASAAVANATYGTAIDKMLALSGNQSPGELHQHVHLHSNVEALHAQMNEQTKRIIDAIKPKKKVKS